MEIAIVSIPVKSYALKDGRIDRRCVHVVPVIGIQILAIMVIHLLILTTPPEEAVVNQRGFHFGILHPYVTQLYYSTILSAYFRHQGFIVAGKKHLYWLTECSGCTQSSLNNQGCQWT